MEESAGGPTISVLRLDGESGYGNSEPLEVQEDPTHGRYPWEDGPKRTFFTNSFIFPDFFSFGVGEWKGEVWGTWAKSLICSAKKLETTWRSQIQGPSGEISKGQKYNLGKFFWTLFCTLHKKKHIPPWETENHLQKCHFWGTC